MRRVSPSLVLVLSIGLANHTAAAQGTDSTAAATAGARDGSAAGRSASMSSVRWGSAAATFFLTPVLGGVAVLVRSGNDPDGAPSVVPPPPGPIVSSAAYDRAYRDAYRDQYLPRRRHTMRSTMIVTSAVFFAAAAAFSG
jgi:hypothetical protein